ncbi:3-deoxy-D-manno-octulosonic acid transferase [Candidatus Pelagibacter sp.]|nr:3-deoxy-D-manno-octulosonic acid transferase [Candidatus Pelagibacter sp.]
MIILYRLIINLIFFISPIIIVYRLFRGKEDINRFKEKFCFFSKKKIKGKLIWLHGASVGEILSVIPLIESFEKDNKIKQILVTSNTLSSSKILSQFKFKKTIHQFFPIDTSHHAQKFLNYWRPSLAIFIDSEIWPNVISKIKTNTTSLILLNARITKKTFKRWLKLPGFAKNLFQRFDICLTSNLESKNYLKTLGAKNIKYIGNLKFSQSDNNKDDLNNHVITKISSKKIWCASSTHHGEEKNCLYVHKKLKVKYKNLLTIIIPRHVERVNEIIKEIKKLNLNVHIHNSKTKMKNNTDIYLINSYGKTKSFFKICKIVFLGGSIVKHGGQNPLEAVRYGCQILHGPNIWNFKEIYNLLNKFKISNKINNINQMTKIIDSLFKNKTTSQKIKVKINNLGIMILTKTLKEINHYIVQNEIKKT